MLLLVPRIMKNKSTPSIGYKPEINLIIIKPVDEKIDQLIGLKKPVNCKRRGQ
ncbi:MAG: hypothetical protein HeimC3_35540 [Candidatus Heimdallarchaeota archaeon LC_3]|nr:MAG: hypothetical protein HeimC3_35540 [Candidatus Heimdallarchaeota archaeon LC_3]